jgi:hypothetical protein
MPRWDQLSFLMFFIIQKILGQSGQKALIYCLPVEPNIISIGDESFKPF